MDDATSQHPHTSRLQHAIALAVLVLTLGPGLPPAAAGPARWVLWTQSQLIFHHPQEGTRWLAAAPLQLFDTRDACEAAVPRSEPVVQRHFTAITVSQCWPAGVDPRRH
jgi:hypothetical protein